MKKVGMLVYDDSQTGGAERVAKGLANELAKKYEVYIISLFQEKESTDKKNLNYNHKVLLNDTVSITKNIIHISKLLKEYLLLNEIDVLLSITAGVNTVAVMATRKTNIKTVYCEHSNLENKTYGRKHQLRQYIGAKFMNKIVTLTQRDKNNFIKKYNLPQDKIICIPNWFNYNENKESQYNINSKKIITVGRLEKVKGYDLLVKVAKLVNKNHPDWKWDIYGDGKYRDKIERDIDSNNLNDVITLKGNVNNIMDLYNEYSIFVMTSYYEGLPLALLEAQEARLPIISFDCPTGPSEIIENNKNGFIINCYDIELMANKICYLIENGNKRLEFSSYSQINIHKFNKTNIINKWIKLIENV